MNYLKKLSVALLGLSMMSAGAEAQQLQDEEELTKVLTYMKHVMLFNQRLPQEKVYLHFDNTGYFMGETIWFTAYVTRVDKNKTTDLSRVLYVELVNPSGDVVETRKYPIENGVASGNIDLVHILTSGFYEVRAYTRYMTNWGSGGIFSRVFPIFEAPKKEGDYSNPVISTQTYKKRLPNIRSNEDDAVVGKAEDKRLSVHFYPEGGHLIKGLRSRIAFLVTDKTGNDQELGGLVLDENKETLFAVATQYEGKGVFDIVHDGKPKYLRIADAKGNQHDFLIPEPEPEGVALRMDMLKDDNITATIQASPAMLGKLMGYTLMHNGKVLVADTTYCNGAFAIPFDRKTMPEGVSQLTLFTADGHIQAERQFFICPKSLPSDTIRFTSPMRAVKPCGKVIVKVHSVPNSRISLSAMDAETMVNGKNGNFKTWMLLSSDIKGYIHNPEYYFEADDREHRMAADLLMMVQGWRRYDWALMADAIDSNEGYTLFNKESADFHQPMEDKLYLFGSLKEKSKKYKVDEAWLTATLYNRAGEHLKGQAKTDSVGGYAFELPDIYGEMSLIINTGVDHKGYWKDAKYYVGIDRHFSPARRFLMPNETKVQEAVKSNLFNEREYMNKALEDYRDMKIQSPDKVLPNVVVSARRRVFEQARASWQTEKTGTYYSQMFYDAAADADKYEDLGLQVPTLWGWLNSRNKFFTSNTQSDNATLSESVSSSLDSSAPGEATMSTLGGDMTESNTLTNDQIIAESEKGLDGQAFEQDHIEGHGEFEDGLAYKNRPIVWILNNAYVGITHLGAKKLNDLNILLTNNQPMPIFIDEVKSVYVSESPDAYRNVLLCSDLRGMDPVTVFVYTHLNVGKDKKGVRSTYFNGFNEVKTFQMEDYSYYPPMEDFRRTIYWAPDVKTDKDGNAHVEFWNNSSVHEMYINAEGLAPNGKVLFSK